MSTAAAEVIVVGGGSAGCVVAARLAEKTSRSVLLLEAGPDVRAATPDGLRDGWDIDREAFDWSYRATPNVTGVERNVWRKRALGGTSWLTRFTPRGGPADFDAWATAGNQGWAWDDVVPYFVKLETDVDFGHEPWHGDAGPLPSNRYVDVPFTTAGAAAADALRAAGFEWVEDHNRPGAVGFGRMPMSSRRGARVTTVDAYLALGATPPNLTVLCDTTVGALVVTRGRAVGVRLLDGTTIEADRVVVCAGTYGSPLLLMRSGIGPAAHLRELGIPVVADLRGVGENLADHPACYVECGRLTPERQQPALHLIATFHSEGRPSTETPDLMFWIADPAGPASAQSSFDIDIVLLRPDSRGRVRLRSPDPVDPPIIELPRLDLRVDIQRLAEAHRRAVMVANCPQVRDVCDGPAVAELSAADLDDYLPREAYSIPHTVGTCAMGRDPDGGAVVDASLGVHGVEALNVVDASVMPDAPSGFTQVPTIMIAERFADRFADS